MNGVSRNSRIDCATSLRPSTALADMGSSIIARQWWMVSSIVVMNNDNQHAYQEYNSLYRPSSHHRRPILRGANGNHQRASERERKADPEQQGVFHDEMWCSQTA